MKTQIIDGTIRCPKCLSVFEVEQHKSSGAAYAKHWRKLPKFHIQFLSWWLSNEELRWKDLTKAYLRERFKTETKHGVGENPFNARISELKANELVIEGRRNIMVDGKTITTPTYKMDVGLVSKIISSGGKIRP
jgi:hypothetical protein